MISSSPSRMDVDARNSPTTAATQPHAARVLAIAGCTNAGKSTLAKAFVRMFGEEGTTVELIEQDDFYLSMEKVERRWRRDKKVFFYDYDSASSVDVAGMCKKVVEASSRVDYVLVEGNLLTEMDEFMELVDRVVFLTLNQMTCRRRRVGRVYDPPDVDGYFDEVVWPAYQRHLTNALALAREDSRLTFLDVSRDEDVNEEEHVMQLIQSLSDDVVRITFDTLDIQEAMRMASSPSCGATSVFVGTTRDTFDGRSVVRLEYESYDEMAYKELRKLCALIRSEFPTVERCVIYHRIGEVAVGETSVIIATSSPHRTDAIRATERAIDELKRTVPIWKKEAYADGGAAWKENSDWHPRLKKEEEKSAGDNHQATPTQRDDDEKAFAEASRARDTNRKEEEEKGAESNAQPATAPEAISERKQSVLASTSGSSNASTDAAAEQPLTKETSRRPTVTHDTRRDGEARLRSRAFFH